MNFFNYTFSAKCMSIVITVWLYYMYMPHGLVRLKDEYNLILSDLIWVSVAFLQLHNQAVESKHYKYHKYITLDKYETSNIMTVAIN